MMEENQSVLDRIDVLERHINARLGEIEEKVDHHGVVIAQARGGLTAARWLFTALVSLAGLFGISHFYRN